MLAANTVLFMDWEVVYQIKHMLPKQEELSSDPQDSHKKLRVVVGARNSRVAKTSESLRLTGQQVWPAKMPGRVQ